MSDGGRVPPHSEEGERGFLGAALLDNVVVPKAVVKGVQGEAFYVPAHRWVWEAMVELQGKEAPIDLLTVGAELERMGRLEGMGGRVFLERVMEGCVTGAHWEYYLGLVMDGWYRRRAADAGMRVVGWAYGGDLTGREVLTKGAETFAGALPEVGGGRPNAEVLEESCKAWEEIQGHRGKPLIGVECPWRMLTDALCGLLPGLHVLGGRQSAGKTSFEGEIAWHAAARKGKYVLRVTLDATQQELVERDAAREAGVSFPKLRWGYSRKDQVAGTRNVAEEYRGMGERMRIVDGLEDVDDVCSLAWGLKLQGKLDLVTIDYASVLEAMGALGGKSLTDLRVKLVYVSKRLKRFGLQAKVPVLLLSQLNDRSGKEEPDSSFLLESGSLERDARTVTLLYKDDEVAEKWDDEFKLPDGKNVTKKLRPVWVKVDKCKDGPAPVKIPFVFLPHYFQFRPVVEFPRDPVEYLRGEDRDPDGGVGRVGEIELGEGEG